MPPSSPHIPLRELESLIARYFEAETTEAEELHLRAALASGRYPLTPAVREALAVMSLTAVAARRRKKRTRLRAVSAAAAAIAALTVSVGAWHYTSTRSNVCVTYIAGTRVTDRDAVMSIIAADLACMGDAQADMEADVAEQINAFSDIIDSKL